jgi:hypothetical protein
VIEDLNIISQIEQSIGLCPVVFSPGNTTANPDGWISGFYMLECMFSSPEMKTEAKARAFSVLLYLKMKEVLSF